MKILELDLKEIYANDYNPNEMSDRKMAQLKKTLKSNGYLQPIIVRQDKDGSYIIVDGEHRWRAMKDMPEFNKEPQVVVLMETTEEIAKLQTVNINNLHGVMDPIKVAMILKEMMERKGMDDIEKNLGMENDEIKNFVEMADFNFNNVARQKTKLEEAPADEGKIEGIGVEIYFDMNNEELAKFMEAKKEEKIADDSVFFTKMVKTFLKYEN